MGGRLLFSRPGAVWNRLLFQVSLWNRQNAACPPNWMKSRPKRAPKVLLTTLKWTWADPSKHVVFVMFSLLWDTWRGIGHQFGCRLHSGRILFVSVAPLLEIWIKIMPLK